jgi:hypothetical protein
VAHTGLVPPERDPEIADLSGRHPDQRHAQRLQNTACDVDDGERRERHGADSCDDACDVDDGQRLERHELDLGRRARDVMTVPVAPALPPAPAVPPAPAPPRAQNPAVPVTRQVAAIAGAQAGHVTHSQLLASGLGPRVIARWIELGRLRVRHRGVYALGHAAEPPFAKEVAALLACGDGAVLSHRSAALVWELAVIPAGTGVEVTVAGAQRRSRPGLRVHRTTQLDPQDISRRHGLAVTLPARTLLDNTPSLSQRELERALDDAIARSLVSTATVLAMLARVPGRAGGGRLRALAGEDRPGWLTRSEAEEAFLDLVRRARLARPLTNVRLAGYEVDFLWREERRPSRSMGTHSTAAAARSNVIIVATSTFARPASTRCESVGDSSSSSPSSSWSGLPRHSPRRRRPVPPNRPGRAAS